MANTKKFVPNNGILTNNVSFSHDRVAGDDITASAPAADVLTFVRDNGEHFTLELKNGSFVSRGGGEQPNNTTLGYKALDNNRVGNNNVAIGYEAGSAIESTNNNTVIGHPGYPNMSDSVVIGDGVVERIKVNNEGVYINGQLLNTDGGESIANITQNGHGFTVGQAVTYTGGRWELAKADSENTLAWGIVVARADANNFTYAIAGRFEINHGRAPNSWFYLSSTAAGELIETPPKAPYINQLILATDDANHMSVYPYRPMIQEETEEFLSTNATTSSIKLVDHGFVVPQCITYAATGWELARANTVDRLAMGVVVKVIDDDNFIYAMSGRFEIPHGLRQNTWFFLSEERSGALVEDAPRIEQMIVSTDDASHMSVWPYRPLINTGEENAPKDGVDGIDGEDGAEGPQGAQGIQGFKGDKGDQGDKGDTGNPGSQGVQGNQGTGGLKGEDGQDGTSIELKGTVPNESSLPAGADAGDLWITDTDSNGWVSDGADHWTNVGRIRGPIGITGDPGKDGAAGQAGAEGPQGIKGQQGIQGITGAQGSQGIQGDKGIQGVKGSTGDTGSDGTAGLDGNSIRLTGTVAEYDDLPSNGTIGDMWVTENDRHGWVSDGDYGWDDIGRIQGPPGTEGVKGTTGERGQEGPQGAQGNDGLQGTIGVTGDQGKEGVTGGTGLQGPPGLKGDDGIKGNAGLDGNSIYLQGVVPSKDDLPPSGNNNGDMWIADDTNIGYVWDDGRNNDGVAYWADVGRSRGANGVQGDKGDDGQVGVRGEQGPDGPDGIQGIQGVAGGQGVQGVKGDDGIQGGQGPKGDPGEQGFAGPQGTSVELKGTVADEASLPSGSFSGDLWVTADTGDGWVSDGSEGWTNVGAIQGPIGNQGIQGIKGDDGLKGEPGADGSKGEQGVQGNVGGQGTAGLKGDEGETGNTGPIGPKGNPGIQGEAGFKGDDSSVPGPIGPDGPQGIPGDKGDVGPQAPGIEGGQGIQGIQGPNGLKGSQGTQGIAGPRGAAGTNGLDSVVPGPQGNVGNAGPKGDTGSTGSQGPRGLTGDTGADSEVVGPQGKQGIQGIQGLVGGAGDQGVAGPQGSKGDQGTTGTTGPQGVPGGKGNQGDPGDNGADGTSVELKGTVASWSSLPSGAAEGDLWITSDNGNGWVSDGAGGWTDVGAIQGPKGEKGTTGDTGGQGIRGEVGNTGTQGNPGADSTVRGPQGEKGDAGSNGTNGLPGSNGTAGKNGDKGTTGDTGSTGGKGDAGGKGDKGEPGSNGVAGTNGTNGENAPDGTVAGSSLRWNGTDWTENLNVSSTAIGDLTVNSISSEGDFGITSTGTTRLFCGSGLVVSDADDNNMLVLTSDDARLYQNNIIRLRTTGIGSQTIGTHHATGYLISDSAVNTGTGVFTSTAQGNTAIHDNREEHGGIQFQGGAVVPTDHTGTNINNAMDLGSELSKWGEVWTYKVKAATEAAIGDIGIYNGKIQRLGQTLMLQYDPTAGSAVQIGGGGANPITFEATEGYVRARAFVGSGVSELWELKVGNPTGGSSTIVMGDSDGLDRKLHCNSQRVGFLNGAGDAWAASSTDDGDFIVARNFACQIASVDYINCIEDITADGIAARRLTVGNKNKPDNATAISMYGTGWGDYGETLIYCDPGGMGFIGNGSWLARTTSVGDWIVKGAMECAGHIQNLCTEIKASSERGALSEATITSNPNVIMYQKYETGPDVGILADCWGAGGEVVFGSERTDGTKETFAAVKGWQISSDTATPTGGIALLGVSIADAAFPNAKQKPAFFSSPDESIVYGGLRVSGITTLGEAVTVKNGDVTIENGDLYATGNVTAFSDARLKDNVETITGALDKVLCMRGVFYNRNDLSDDQNAQRKVGVIAQEMEKILPEVVVAVKSNPDDKVAYTDPIKAVDYGNIVGVLIEAIKEQQDQIDDLEERLNASI